MATKRAAPAAVVEPVAPTVDDAARTLAERAAAAVAGCDRAEFSHNGQRYVAVRDADGAVYVENRGA